MAVNLQTAPIASPTVSDQVEVTRKTAEAVIDCDIHSAPASDAVLYKYLPKRWQEYHSIIGSRGHAGGNYTRAVPNAARRDAWPPTGEPPGSNLDFLRAQL